MAAGNTFSQIASTTLGSAASSVTFSSIPGTYTDLVLVVNAAVTVSAAPLFVVNSNFSSIYSETFLRGDGTSAASGRITGASNINTAINPTASTQFNEIIQFQNYANTNIFKTILWRGDSTPNFALAGVGLWRNTAAINAIEVYLSGSNFIAGSTFNLYGITAA
jgi:hypothetical protein